MANKNIAVRGIMIVPLEGFVCSPFSRAVVRNTIKSMPIFSRLLARISYRLREENRYTARINEALANAAAKVDVVSDNMAALSLLSKKYDIVLMADFGTRNADFAAIRQELNKKFYPLGLSAAYELVRPYKQSPVSRYKLIAGDNPSNVRFIATCMEDLHTPALNGLNLCIVSDNRELLHVAKKSGLMGYMSLDDLAYHLVGEKIWA